MRPSDMLRAISKLNQEQYDERYQFLFKVYQNSRNCCFVISWLQAFLSIEPIKDAITEASGNNTSKLLKEIIKVLENSRHTKIHLEIFIRNWDGWNGNSKLPTDQ